MKLDEIIRVAILIGRRNGFVTTDQVNELLPANTAEPEDIEVFFLALSEERIEIRGND
jgi:hypothetical protein